MIKLNRTLFGRLFALNTAFDKNRFSPEYKETFKLGNNWHGGLIYKNTYKKFYGNPKNNICSKYSHIWINHNIQHLYFTEEFVTITTDNISHTNNTDKIISLDKFLSANNNIYNQIISSNYKLKRTRFLETPIVENIDWINIPKSLIYHIDKKTIK
jgi:hypothetical protein